MDRIGRAIVQILATAIVASALGCAAQQRPVTGVPAPAGEEARAPEAPSPKVSGFLEDYSLLQPGTGGVDLAYVKDGVDFGAYDKLIVDPVLFLLKADSGTRSVRADELQALSESFRQIFGDILGNEYPPSDHPGPGVLYLRAAVTEVIPNRPALGVAFAILPGGFLAYAVLPAKYNNIGAATFEAELYDSAGGERLAAWVDRRPGKKTEVFSGMATWGHAKKAFKIWAQMLKGFLDQRRAGPPSPSLASK